MNDPLVTYLEDHLAGAVHAIELVETIRDRHSNESLGQFAQDLLGEIQQDRQVLLGLAEHVGLSSSTAKDAAAWLGEKVSRVKLRQGHNNALGTFEALEVLALGIHGKWAMWRALATVAPHDARLRGTDFDQLTARAQTQYSQVDERRLSIAAAALRPEAA
jgi:hypothetical protein